MSYSEILFDKSERIATISLNQPEKRNVIGHQMMDDLLTSFKDIAGDKGIRVAILTATGNTFSLGADVREYFYEPLKRSARGGTNVRQDFFSSKFIPVIMNLGKPIIAAINGPAAGLACTICLVCDIRLAAEKTRFNLGFAGLGLTPELSSTYFLPRIIGLARTLEILYTGKTVEAQEAKEIGLINKVVPAEQLMETARDMARTIADNSTTAIRLIREGIYQGMFTDIPSALKWENLAFDFCLASEDHAKVVKAFFEKNKPDSKVS